MAPKYKINYFPAKGLAECMRYILSYMGEEFEDDRFNRDDWPKIKPTTPFGKVPVLTVNGKEVAQSVACTRYLARQAGLAGSDAWEDLQIDIIVDTITDLRLAIANYYYDPDEKSKAEKKGPVVSETIPFYMKKFEDIAQKNGGYLANGKLTWADFYLVSVGEYMSFIAGMDLVEPYPTLKALKKKIQSFPKIKEWIEKRPKSEM